MRKKLLTTTQWNSVIRLGPRCFQTPMWDFNITLITITNQLPSESQRFFSLDVSTEKGPKEKDEGIQSGIPKQINQSLQLTNPGLSISFESLINTLPIKNYADIYYGSKPGQTARVTRSFWELPIINPGQWMLMESSPEGLSEFSGKSEICLSIKETEHQKIEEFGIRGASAWGKHGIIFSKMNKLPCSIYTGQFYDDNTYTIIPKNESEIEGLYVYVMSGRFNEDVRKLNQKTNITREIAEAVPFDCHYWEETGKKKYPNGLPKPYSDDPRQWLFNGHPGNSEQPLQVAVARLLGYRWPRQTGSSFRDCPAISPDGLEAYADEDGIICINAVKGETNAAERLRVLLAAAYGNDWSNTKQSELLSQVEYAGKTLEDWLRNGFFEQHCQLFHQRPFIWNIWDGLKNGFSVLGNYHKLDRANLEKLTYTYLGDWIARQRAAVAAGEEGSDAKLIAALELQRKLRLILDGEQRYDIFVRWKTMEKQPIGWEPDLNDGVRLNIRPFMTAGILRKNPKINWNKDRGTDVPSAPWFSMFHGERINEHHLTLEEKRTARANH